MAHRFKHQYLVIDMRRVFSILGLLLLSASAASWLRMCDPLLSMSPWSRLVGQPIKVWVGSVIFYPVYELLFTWPAYLAGGLVFFALTKKWPSLTSVQSTGVGAVLGLTFYLLYAFVHGQWFLQTHSLVIKEAIVYTVSGTMFGFFYNRFMPRTPPLINPAVV